jgi:hypothetical protein
MPSGSGGVGIPGWKARMSDGFLYADMFCGNSISAVVLYCCACFTQKYAAEVYGLSSCHNWPHRMQIDTFSADRNDVPFWLWHGRDSLSQLLLCVDLPSLDMCWSVAGS